jgi:hypothetical protein
MTRALIPDAQVAAGFPPLAAVWQNASSAKSKLGEQMRQLMPQCSIDFSRAKFPQRWVERDEATPKIGATHRRPHTSIPFHPQARRETFRIEGAQKRHGVVFQFARRRKRKNLRRVEAKFELPKRRLFSRCVSHSSAAQSLKQS